MASVRNVGAGKIRPPKSKNEKRRRSQPAGRRESKIENWKGSLSPITYHTALDILRNSHSIMLAFKTLILAMALAMAPLAASFAPTATSSAPVALKVCCGRQILEHVGLVLP